MSDLYIHFSMCSHKYKVMIKDWSILHALTFWMHVHQATPLQRHLHSIHFQWSTHVLAHLASSRATMLANAFSTPTNITEFGRISSCCICWNNSIAFHLYLHFTCPNIMAVQVTTFWDGILLNTLQATSQGCHILHTCPPSCTPTKTSDSQPVWMICSMNKRTHLQELLNQHIH